MTEQRPKPINEMDFETAYAALQENVAQLEGEELPLEKALSLYELGQQLAKRCATLLEQAELKVRTLSLDTLSQDKEES
jgi:exodeoxyribonuclease VII small subunit